MFLLAIKGLHVTPDVPLLEEDTTQVIRLNEVMVLSQMVDGSKM